MPDFDIRTRFLTKLPEAEKGLFSDTDALGQRLFDDQSGNCALCMQPIKANDVAQVDHDLPEAREGETKLDNLQLAHADCNAFKRDLTTEEIRPFCEFRRHLDDLKNKSHSTKYGDVISHPPFETTLKKSTVTVKRTRVEWDLPDEGSPFHSPIWTDDSYQRETHHRFTYVEVPQAALWSDKEVQPRNINLIQLFKIYRDLVRNPLHEPPCCRLGPEENRTRELLMFDGQHKTIAYWLHGNSRIVVKVYIDLDGKQANRLVVSVQSEVPKLVLTPFEISAKLSRVARVLWEPYLEAHEENPSEMSEQGWIDSLATKDDKARAKKYYIAMLFDNIIKDDEFELSKYAMGKLDSKISPAMVSETMVKNKWTDNLIGKTLFTDEFEKTESHREIEKKNIIWLTNKMVELMVEPKGKGANGALDKAQLLRRSRFFKQPSLEWVANLCLKLYDVVVLPVDSLSHGMFTEMNDPQKERLELYLARVAAHPCWTAAEDRNDEMRALVDTLGANRKGGPSFEAVVLTAGYVVDPSARTPF